MRRREFIIFISATAAWSVSAHAQQSQGTHRVGVFLYLNEQDSESIAYVAALEDRLRALGWIPGGNL
jgi:hypothetical protein